MEVTMELRLTDKEQELLVEILQEQHKHLLHQIAKTDHYEFKTMLRNRCGVLEGLVEKIKAPVHTAA
jgi:hypothetical protein